jgi:hypothetical protein
MEVAELTASHADANFIVNSGACCSCRVCICACDKGDGSGLSMAVEIAVAVAGPACITCALVAEAGCIGDGVPAE